MSESWNWFCVFYKVSSVVSDNHLVTDSRSGNGIKVSISFYTFENLHCSSDGLFFMF